LNLSYIGERDFNICEEFWAWPHQEITHFDLYAETWQAYFK
jgi:hypothetical protein